MKTPEGQKTLEDNISSGQSRTRKRQQKTKLYEARLAVAVRLFGQDSGEVEMLSHPDIHSDDEALTSNSRQKLRLQWRSSELDTFIALLDLAHWKRKRIPIDIKRAKQLVDRGVYAPDPDPDRFPPKGFQLSLVSPIWYEEQEGLVIDELQLNDHSPVDIKAAIEGIKRTFRSIASLAAEEAGGSASALNMTTG